MFVTKASLKWARELIFNGMTPRGYDLDFDERSEWGCTPTEALLLAVGGCMAMDVVSILDKMRCPVSALSMDMEADRADDHPRRFTKMRIALRVSGAELTEEKLDRAIALSRDKYCSVFHSIRPDIPLEVERTIVPAEAESE